MEGDEPVGAGENTAPEVTDLLLSVSIVERMNAPLLLEHLSAARQVVVAFTETHARTDRISFFSIFGCRAFWLGTDVAAWCDTAC